MSKQSEALEVARDIVTLENRLAQLHERFGELVPNDTQPHVRTKRVRPKRRWTSDTRMEAVEDLLNGGEVKEVGERYGVCVDTIWRLKRAIASGGCVAGGCRVEVWWGWGEQQPLPLALQPVEYREGIRPGQARLRWARD